MPSQDAQSKALPFAGVIGAVTAALLAVIAPMVVMAATPDASTTASEIALGVTCWSGLRIAWLVARGQPFLYSVVTWAFFYVWFGLAPLLQLRSGLLPDTTPFVHSSTFSQTMAAVLLGITGTELGLRLAERTSPNVKPGRHLSFKKAQALAIATIPFIGYVTYRTGIQPLFTSREALSAARIEAFPNSTVAALASGMSLAFPLVALHALVLLRRRRRALGQTPRAFLLTFGTALLLLTTVNIFSSARIYFGTVLLSLLILAGALNTQRRIRASIVTIVLILVFVFPAADLFRFGDAGVSDLTVRSGWSSLSTSGDFDAFTQTANTVAYVNHNGPTYGMQALGVALFWVPRSIWPDKPKDTGVLVAEWTGYDFTNLSASIWAEAYVNGGLLLVLLVGVLLGYLVRWADKKLMTDVRGPSLATAAGAILPFYLLIVLRGSLLQASGALVALLAALWLVSEPPVKSSSPDRSMS